MKRKAYGALFVSVLISGALVGLPGCSSSSETAHLAQTGASQESPKTSISKTELASLIEEAKKVKTENYTPESIQELTSALNEAKEVSVSKEATQEQVDEAAANLQKALDGIVLAEPDMTELSALLDEAKAIDTSLYKEGVDKLEERIESAQETLDSESPTVTEVEQKTTWLQNAIDELVMKEQPVRISGSGDDMIEIPSSTLSLLTITYTGPSNFAVKSLTESLDSIDLIVNTIGDYHGTQLMLTKNNKNPYYLEINSSGNWDIDFQPIESASFIENGATLSGDDVVFLPPQDAKKLNITYSGEHNFVVRGVSLSTGRIDLLVNEIGSYSGSVPNKSYAMLLVESSGDWSVSW